MRTPRWGGRFVLDWDQAGLLHAYVATKADREGSDWPSVFSIALSTLVPVVREHYDNGELVCTLEPACWGLRPSWAKEKGRGRSMPATRR